MRRLVIIIFLFPALATVAQKKGNPKIYSKLITTADMKANLHTLAGDEMEGRETATEGQRKAANFIENKFRSFGLLPGNNGSYQMQYPVYIDTLVNASVTVNESPFEAGKDFSFSIGASHTASYDFSQVLFPGFGISDSARDDYKGVDARGKLVMVLSPNISGNISPKARRSFNFYTQQQAAMDHGAAALLVVEPEIAEMPGKGNMYVNIYHKVMRINTFFVSEKLAAAIVGDEYAAKKAEALQGETVTKQYEANVALAVDKKRLALHSSNVLGLLEGTDLKDEYVILSAHYDHLGRRGNTIWYGADDDASGTTSILELAKAFSKAKAEGRGPRRSILFMTVSGEEKGLWGSDYYGSHPVYPLDKTTVDLNIDMVGRIDPSRKYGDSTNYIYVIGDDKLSSDLKPISEAINKKNTKLELDYKYNDPKDPERIYIKILKIVYQYFTKDF